ncbi:ATP-grasp fold amidoligase family protein [Garciella nitratireducens]|uniref:ATP-grasp fold amidoligase family protein n=1 Tax=Garciella nitratireducens TaxID=218205 RepID=UPI000DE9B1E5|nr:ATP-grasp fold amidoligase family protein [Garciella nitratireducens]RBP42239.1 teichuronopeptide biosynthesis TupA-like protein [Garciella nitratireducens]
MIKKIIKAFKKPRLAILYVLGFKSFRIIPDSLYLKIKYRLIIGKKLNLKKAQTFNEKLQWLKLYDRNPLYTKLVDKYEVRKHIAETIGEEHLIPLLGIYDSFEEINFDDLPNQFVLKPNHTSGDIYICKDKSKINYVELKKKVDSWLKRNYYWIHREWPYKNIKPRIICEKYMVDESGMELKDYKFMCFNGEVKCLFVCLNRNSQEGLNVDFYDMGWNPMPFERHYKRSGKLISKPKTFDKMVHFSKILSRNIPFVRVDFYEVNGHLYFGELTFYPGSGFEEFTPEKYDYILGSWLKLPSDKIR